VSGAWQGLVSAARRLGPVTLARPHAVRAIHQLHASRWEARHQLRKSLREARRSLRDLVFTGADDAAIQAKTAEVQQLVAQGVQMRVEGLRAMSQILTPEQRDKLRQRRPTWH